jgi:glycosyltransferase involved in cell wall biosynthesis
MRICIVPEYPASLMTGGLQVQADETCRALAALGGGLEAELFNWSERRPLADLYHFIGFPPHLHRLTELLRQAGRPYVITMLFGGSQDSRKLWMAKIRRTAKSHLLRSRERFDAIHGARNIITITDADAEAARFIYSLKPSSIKVVPHGLNETFFTASAAEWRTKMGAEPFVLSVGAIQRRKGQLLLTEVCNQLKLPVVLLGPILPGEAGYADAVGQAMRQNEKLGGRWIESLRNEDTLLASAYAACHLFVLLSVAETQPLSVMQAMAARRPILLLEAPYAADRLFANLPRARSTDPDVVAAALRRTWHEAKPTYLAPDYAWPGIARQLSRIYESVFLIGGSSPLEPAFRGK